MSIKEFFSGSSNSDVQSKNPYYKRLYGAMNRVSTFMVFIGLIAFLLTFFVEQSVYIGLAILIAFVWMGIFIRYFSWALYFYNINYGWTDRDWQRYEEALDRKREGKYVAEEELNAPKYNIYRSQSFGLPTGTVRGMIALTLLFGALSMLVASFGMDGNLDSDAFYWDHFEFFKTAFLMMIAFYFGDKSLKYLNKRSNASRQKSYWENNGSGDQQSESDDDLAEDDKEFEQKDSNLAAASAPPSQPPAGTVSLTSLKKALANSEAEPNPTGLIPIIDAGHGGIDPNTNKYVTAPKKMYTYHNSEGEPDNLFIDEKGNETNEIYEGVVNREIGKKLAELLKSNGIKYFTTETLTSYEDKSLGDRVKIANEKYKKNPNVYLLSIHSNASGIVASPGPGSTKAKGFEVFTSVGETKSDQLADIAAKWYKKEFSDFKFRQDMSDGDEDKEAQFFVLRKTACPAILVENLFFDNPIEAKFLMSEAGQMRIAKCLFNIVKEIYQTQNNGITA